MRIAFLLPNYSGHVVGSLLVYYRFAEELDRRGHLVDILHPALDQEEGRATARLRASAWAALKNCSTNPIPWHRFSKTVRPKFQVNYDRLDLDHDVVVGFSWRGLEAMARLDFPGARFGYVVEYETWAEADPTLRKRMEAAYLSGPPVLSSSAVVEKMLREIGVRDVRPCVHGIDLGRIRRESHTSIRDLDVGFPVRMEAVKSPEVLLETLRVLRQRRGRKLRLWGFGRPNPPSDLAELLDDFHPDPSDAKLSELYSRTSVFVVPSRKEGFGMPAAEAMAAGCAVVSTDNGGILTFGKDGVNCRIVAPDSPEDLVDATLDLLDAPELRRQLSENAQKSVEFLSWEKAGDRLETALGLTEPEHADSESPDPPSTIRTRSVPRPCRIVFVHTAGIDLPPERKSGTDLAVGSLLREIEGRWPTHAVHIPSVRSSIWTRHIAAFREEAMPVIVERLSGAPHPESVLRPGDRIVLADDYAGLLLGRGWRPALLIRHNAFHDSYSKVPRSGLLQRLILDYHSRLARQFDEWTSRAALGVVAPAGTTERLLRKLSPEARILTWRPMIPRRPGGPFPIRSEGPLRGVFFGNFEYGPNLEALQFLCHVLAPALAPEGIRFRVAGPSVTAKSRMLRVPPNVEIHGFQDDIEAFASDCDFGILPLFHGEGILLKTLTLMGYGMPLVATTKAAAGTGLRHGVDALIADDLAEMVHSVRILSDPSLREAMGRNAWTTSRSFSQSSGILDAIGRVFQI